MRYETFKDFLKKKNPNITDKEIQEQVLASDNDFWINLIQTSTTKTVMGINWVFVADLNTKIKGMKLYKLKSSNLYRAGRWEIEDEDADHPEELFVSYGEIEIEQEVINDKAYDAVRLVRVLREFRGNRIAEEMYRALVKIEKLNLISDAEQYFGARKLWSKLSRQPDLKVTIFDTLTGEKEDKIIKHGNVNDAFDKTVWSNKEEDYIAKNVRLILKDVL